MLGFGRFIARHKLLVIVIGFLLLIPAAIGTVVTPVNYDLLSYLPDTLDVDTDIDVLETMLKRDGLSGSDFEQAEQEGTPGTMN